MSQSRDDASLGLRHLPPRGWSLAEFRQNAENLSSVRSINPKGFHNVAFQTWGEETFVRPAICVHGLTRHGGDFEPLAQVLSQRQRVICPDLVGRGASDWLPDGSDYHVPQYNCDLVTLMAATGCREVDWIGTSLGGLCGIMLAGMPNTPIRRLILNDIAPEVPLPALRRVSRYLSTRQSFDDFDEVEAHLRQVYSGFAPMGDDAWHHMARTSVYRGEDGCYAPHFDPDIGANFQNYWLVYRFNIWSYWKRITCPILILRGKDSDFLTRGLLDRMLMDQPKAIVHEYDGVGHTPMLNCPEQIEPIRDWLDAD
jgi:pimeloyl-ACP methyl ester carboxylesterase